MAEVSAPVLKIRNLEGEELKHRTIVLSNTFLFIQVVLSLDTRTNIAEAHYNTFGTSKLKIKLNF